MTGRTLPAARLSDAQIDDALVRVESLTRLVREASDPPPQQTLRLLLAEVTLIVTQMRDRSNAHAESLDRAAERMHSALKEISDRATRPPE